MDGSRLQRVGNGLLVLCASTLALSLPATGAAQAPQQDTREYLEQVRRLNDIAAQKLEAEVRTGLGEASRWRTSDAKKAVAVLKGLISQLNEDTALTATRRQQLVRLVNDRIRLTEKPPRSSDPQRRPDPSAGRATDDARTAEAKNINACLDKIRGLQREGRNDEAKRQVDDLVRRYPDNLTVQFARRTVTMGGQIATLRMQAADADQRLAAFSRDVDNSATPPAGEVDFPKNWAEITKKRASGSSLTAKEKAILQALNTPVNVSFQGTRFRDVIETLENLTNQQILLDETALTEASISYETPVNLTAKGLSLRTVLRKALGEFGLTFVIKDQSLQVTSREKAKDLMVVRSYPIGDMVGNPAGIGGIVGIANTFEPPHITMAKQINQIIELIEASVEPSSWKKEGGLGTITFHAPTMSLVIRQSAEVQAMLSSSLK